MIIVWLLCANISLSLSHPHFIAIFVSTTKRYHNYTTVNNRTMVKWAMFYQCKHTLALCIFPNQLNTINCWMWPSGSGFSSLPYHWQTTHRKQYLIEEPYNKCSPKAASLWTDQRHTTNSQAEYGRYIIYVLRSDMIDSLLIIVLKQRHRIVIRIQSMASLWMCCQYQCAVVRLALWCANKSDALHLYCIY